MSDSLRAPSPLIPVPQGPLPELPAAQPVRMVELQIDGRKLFVSEGTTILEAARQLGIETPTLCFLENLTPVNVCRLCVVELEGSRVLVPACSRKVEAGMVIRTDSERVRLSRKMVLEFLASSVDLSTWPAFAAYSTRYGANPSRFGEDMVTDAQPVKVDNELYVRDYAQMRALLQMRASMRRGSAIHICHRRGGPGVRRTHCDGIRDTTAGIGMCVLRELHWGLPDGRVDVPVRIRNAARGKLGRGAANAHGYDLPVLRRRMRPDGARARRKDCESDFAAGPLRDQRTLVHQGSLRLAVCADSTSDIRRPLMLRQARFPAQCIFTSL